LCMFVEAINYGIALLNTSSIVRRCLLYREEGPFAILENCSTKI
jgi:hypothetical protein